MFNKYAHRKNLEFLADVAHKQHLFQMIDIPRFQYGLLRTYLWISAFLLTTEITVADYFHVTDFFNADVVSIRDFFIFFIWFLALGIAFITFCIGVDAMRGRRSDKLGLADPGEWAMVSWNLSDQSKWPREEFLNEVIITLHSSIAHNLATNNQLGAKLRAISRLLVLSACLFGWATILEIT